MVKSRFDYKKEFKELYHPPHKPTVIDVPEMAFIMVDGKGNPNSQNGEYQQAVELLYNLSYTIKMSKMGAKQLEGYFDYVVPPLEGLWWLENDHKLDFSQKEHFCWTSMIRQPEFVTADVFQWACQEVAKKKPQMVISKAYFKRFKEGLCVQMMHVGPYDHEPETISQMETFLSENHFKNAISSIRADGEIRRHHEIYLSDPRRTKLENLKTVIRIPIEKL